MFGHLSVPVAFDEAAELDEVELDAEDDAFADGLAVAAWAIAEPPPTRTPVIARVIAARFSCCRICVTSSVLSSNPVKLAPLKIRWVCAEEHL
jgi:hypothetical protein